MSSGYWKTVDGCTLELKGPAYKHRIKRGSVTISGKPGEDIAPGTLNSFLKQAELK
jgi:hypothetical protein